MAKIRLAKEEFDKAVKELEPEILLQARRGKWSERQKKRMKVIKVRKILHFKFMF